MTSLALLLLGLVQADPLRLPIPGAGEMTVKPGWLTSAKTAKPVSLAAVLDHARNSKFVYVGESHTSPRHHAMQADIIEGLARRGFDVIVGLEMFTRAVQDQLNPWTLGWWTEEQFIKNSDWKTQWGFDYALYRPVFEAVRRNKLRMVALNVPRDWVRAVGRGGFEALTSEQRAQLPPITAAHPLHKQMFDAMMGGHPMTGTQGSNMYQAQCLWDIAMADSAVKYLKTHYVSPKTIFVVVAGSGHIMYNSAIPYRVNEYMKGVSSTTIVCADTETPIQVSRAIADFVYASPPPPAK